jgi:lipoprotein-anchoring transpeptidase ErfK/SrfK
VILRHLPVNDPVSASVYKRAMMNNRILTLLATVAAIATGTSIAHAQGYPSAAGSYATSTPGDYRRGSEMPNFDNVDDEDGAPSAALPPPGPVTSPDDPRYGRPLSAPSVYSDRAPASQGPVMSPDDPRYGRPMGAPVYSERAPVPQGPVMSPDDPRYGRPSGPPSVIYSDRNDGSLRPPEAVGAGQPGVPQQSTGSVPAAPQLGADGRPVQLAALPPEEQPEADQGYQLPPNLRRQEVAFQTKEPAGTIVVDTSNTYLYYVLGSGRAMRYGVRVGRDGFTWNGVQKITRKAEWPDWHPPTEMIERQPYLPRFMAGGPGNPLGARAMYLGSTVYRIHGTNQPSTIGKFVSSGCIGMLNDDVSDLFERTKVGTRVVVMPGGAAPPPTASAQPQPVASAAAGPQPQQSMQMSVPGTQPTAVAPLPAPVTIR